MNIFVALIIITFQEQGEAELSEGDLDKNQVCEFLHMDSIVYIKLVEAMHRLCSERATTFVVHARRQEFDEISYLAIGDIDTI